MKKFLKNLLHHIYPNFCLFCLKKIDKNFFCENCQNHFEVLEKDEIVKPQFLKYHFISVFEKVGIQKIFFQEFKNIHSLIKLGAAFMVFQYLRFNSFPVPDFVCPLVENFFESDLHIKTLSKEIKKTMKTKIFYKKFFFNKDIKNKTILLISDEVKEDKFKKYIRFFEKKGVKDLYVLVLFQ